jgi:membrane protein YqaA with SNARE-associated domain
MFDSLYARVKALAESPHAEAALAAVAFAESSFFPIPPDILLAPMALAEPLRAAMERNFAAVLGGFAALVVAGFIIAVKVF